jgi:16S rRNA processing protein RimM
MSLVQIGRLGRPHGVNGEMALDSCDLTPLELHDVGRFVWRGPDGRERPLIIRTARPAHDRMLVAFDGIDRRETASELTNGLLMAQQEQLPDPGPGHAYHFQLIGLEVRTDDGRVLGTLEDIVRTGAHPVYVVRGARELLLPAVPDVIRKLDLEAGTLTVTLPAGLEEAMG